MAPVADGSTRAVSILKSRFPSGPISGSLQIKGSKKLWMEIRSGFDIRAGNEKQYSP